MSKPPDWDARQAQLLHEIEQFSMSKTPLDATPPQAEASIQVVVPLATVPTKPAPVLPIDQPPVAVTNVNQAATGGLLEQLKRKAEAKQATNTQNVAQEAARLRQIDAGLRAAYSYLNDLNEQLNVLKPSYPGDFPLGTLLRMERLTWQEGRADYRRQPGATDNLGFERVSLRYTLGGDKPIILEKSDHVVETTRKTLSDFGLSFTTDETRNAKGFVERCRFTVQPIIKTGLLFVADYAKGEVRLRTLNIQRFGSAEYLVPPEAISEQTLEEIALLILGESNQFVQRFDRVA